MGRSSLVLGVFALACLGSAAPASAASPSASLALSASRVPGDGGQVAMTISAADAVACRLSSTPALWSGASSLAVGCTSIFRVTLPSTARARQWTLTLTAKDRAGNTASATRTLVQTPLSAAAALALGLEQKSSIWSGYVVPSSGPLITEASGRWTVPRLSCDPARSSGVASWVGIGGQDWATGGSSGTLLQTGITSDCVQGAQENRVWWEEFPSKPNHADDFAGLNVSAGDAIEASVYRTVEGSWETRIDDLTKGESGVMITGEGWGVLEDAGDGRFPFQGTTHALAYGGGYTAEWIVEDYSKGRVSEKVPLANFGSVTFTGLTTSLTSWSLTGDEAIEMVQSGHELSKPEAPTRTGFTVAYSG